jgi:hypothetical protein
MDKESAYRLVTAGYEGWLAKKAEEECLKEGGQWIDGKCQFKKSEKGLACNRK